MVGVRDLPSCARHMARSRLRREHAGIRLIMGEPCASGLEARLLKVGMET